MTAIRTSVWPGVVLLLLSNAIIPIAIGIFASGFFPYKAFLPGLNTYSKDDTHTPVPIFDKVIFMVVDALRSDFVYSSESSFNFVQSLIRDGSAIPFTAHATSPTITMPRVKAITTGSIPSFLDVILNFAEADTTSTLANQDSWPLQLRAKNGGKINMFGDDTWIKLFPDFFGRVDGTSSFFVSDFTEVDNNVTRNIPEELQKDDWNGMIMHYLGLDHIGHKSGPRSPHMPGKQREMDHIAQQIYSALDVQPHLRSTLFVMCGDHGMNDAGNHGGSGAGETSPALILMSPRLRDISSGLPCPAPLPKDEFQYYQVIEQSDIAPTLAGLLGFPMPLNNLGVFIPDILNLWSKDDEKLNLLQQNAKQIYNIVKATFGGSQRDFNQVTECDSGLEDGEYLHCLWAISQNLQARSAASTETRDSLLKFLDRAQRVMSSAASNYEVGKLCFGFALSAVSFALGLYTLAHLSNWTFYGATGTMIITILYAVMMFGSSFVEEEHHFWYWSISGWLAYIGAKSLREKQSRYGTYGLLSLLALGSFRLLRRWNQTGQKFTGSPDIAKKILPNHQAFVWILIVCTVGVSGYRIAAKARFDPAVVFSSIAVCLSLLGFKISFTNADAPELLPPFLTTHLDALITIPLSTQANAVFIGLIMLSILVVFYSSKTPKLFRRSTDIAETHQSILSLLLIAQSRTLNIPLFLLFQIQYSALKRLPLRSYEISALALMLQYSTFFAFGGTNAISSVDLSSAYNGVSSYNVAMVGVLTFVGNWAGPIYWSVSSVVLLLHKTDRSVLTLVRYLCDQTLFTAGSLAAVMLACTVLRTHLFIWTVFSPKYLYSMAWSLAQHLLINVLAGWAVWKAGGGA